jgi:putative transcriptional regulator
VKTKVPTQSRILAAVHESATDLHKAGFIDLRRMRQYDALCLPVVPAFTSKDIRALRGRLGLSQPVFASVLNASPSAVRQWEIGQKHPAGMAAKLLDVLDRKGLEGLI